MNEPNSIALYLRAQKDTDPMATTITATKHKRGRAPRTTAASSKKATVRLDDAELAALKAHAELDATAAGEVAALIRNTLDAAGLLTMPKPRRRAS